MSVWTRCACASAATPREKTSASVECLMGIGLEKSGSSDKLDLRAHARRCREPFVARDERCAQRLGESDIRGIIGSHVRAERPDAGQERLVRIPCDGKARQDLEAEPPTGRRD